ncbi:MAG: S41 family peptidase [Thermodesulfobacteriota bacterium]|nr:S41 family peptidase [Thermodesulfobacteriota bacterium]
MSAITSPLARIVIVLMICVLHLVIAPAQSVATTQQPKSAYEHLDLFSDVLYLVQKNYVEPVAMETMVQGAINGMLEELDPHSEYMNPEMFAELEIETTGEFCGLGIEITIKDRTITVIAPIDDTPADCAGIKAGDKIIKIDDKFTKDISIMEAVQMMRGEKGSQITIGVMREKQKHPLEFTLMRQIIRIESIKQQYYQSALGYIRITQFQKRTAKDLRDALSSLGKKSGGTLQGLVLDLRNNPGGLLDQAVKVADLFLDSGDIVSTRGRQEKDNSIYHATPWQKDQQPDYPIVILINGGSASAAEIVAGALQDQHRAIILGTQSFGKGSVQSLIPLNDKSGMRLTTAHYYTPNGTSIQALGITPDIVVEQATWHTAPDSKIREKDLDNHFETPDNSTENTQPVKHKKWTKTAASDYQLLRALDLLRGWQQLKILSDQ